MWKMLEAFQRSRVLGRCRHDERNRSIIIYRCICWKVLLFFKVQPQEIKLFFINLNLKNKVEHFESIEEQFGLTLQKFSVKIVDETSFKLFCEVLALNGEAVNHSFGVEVAVYDSDDNIVYHTSLHSNDFKGFEVYNFGTINLDIPVDEVSKIRVYPV